MRRVVVTGMGVVSALGNDTREFWERLSQGHSGIAPIEGVDRSGLGFANGAQVRDFDPTEHFAASHVALLDRFAQFAVVAARGAVRDAGLKLAGTLSGRPAERVSDGRSGVDAERRVAIVTGTSLGGQSSQDASFAQFYGEQRCRIHPLTVPRAMANAGASQISMDLGVTGPVFTVCTACSSSNHAIGLAFQMVRTGMVDIAIAGGSEAPFSPGFLSAWDAMRVVSPDTCRPFSRDRRGLILGEGGAMLVLETLDMARARGARAYVEIAGFGMSADAHHITQPSAEGPAQAMRAAIEDGGLHLEEIGHINAHGTGTTLNDATETRAIRQIFGSRADRIAVSATKSMHGHAQGAAGAIEAVATILALCTGIVPPTANYTGPDPECDLDIVPNLPRTMAVECALSNSFAFGGLNAVLAFRALAPDVRGI